MQITIQNYAQKIETAFGNTADLIKLDFTCGERAGKVYFIDGLIDKLLFENNILKPLKKLNLTCAPYYDCINTATMMTTPIERTNDIPQSIDKLSSGDIIVVIDEAEAIFIFSEKAYKTRSIQEPPVSNVLRGPREGFVEDLKTNMTLVRRKLASCSLRFETMCIGRYTATKIAVAYIQNIADKTIVEQIKKRIQQIDIDGIIESSYVARYLEENKVSLFSQVGECEKPDIAAAKMLEGRILILVDGSPMALTLPFVLFEHFQASEDYFIKSYRATLVRSIRLIAFLIAILLPATYVALLSYQYQMLPLKFVTDIISEVALTPLTPMLEMILVLTIFEILNEASVRMPRYVGMALSVVGAIVLGETAVNAGLLSTSSILVIAVSTIGMYCVPDESNSASVLRIAFVATAGVLGIFGLIIAFIILVAYLATLNSYGSAYLAPYAPMLTHDWQDGAFKEVTGKMMDRPYTISTSNRHRVNKEDKDGGEK